MVNKEELRHLLKNYLSEHKGVDPNRQFNCISPDHSDEHPSMGCFAEGKVCRCFACGKTYDIFKLIAEDYNLDEKKDFKLILKKIEELYPSDYRAALLAPGSKPEPRKIEKPKIPDRDYSKYYEVCHDRIKMTDYLKKRGIKDEMVEKYNLGYDDRSNMCVFPINKYCLFRRSVVDDTKLNSSGYQNCWGEEKLKDSCESDFVIITESIIDAISLEQINDKYPVISLNSVTHFNNLINAIDEYGYKGNVVIATDNDVRGYEVAEQIKEKLKKMGVEYCFYYPFTHDYKDINEAYLNNPQELIDSYVYLSETLDSIVEQIYNKNDTPVMCR